MNYHVIAIVSKGVWHVITVKGHAPHTVNYY